MGTRYRSKWVFVRHRERQSWEMPAGHIERGETADEAAARELREETGATSFSLTPVSDYSVSVEDRTDSGRFYYAEIHELESQLDYEIEELQLSSGLPSNLTYPEVQSLLFTQLESYLDPDW
jgi:8-oxo-dGTP diphosphatase